MLLQRKKYSATFWLSFSSLIALGAIFVTYEVSKPILVTAGDVPTIQRECLAKIDDGACTVATTLWINIQEHPEWYKSFNVVYYWESAGVKEGAAHAMVVYDHNGHCKIIEPQTDATIAEWDGDCSNPPAQAKEKIRRRMQRMYPNLPDNAFYRFLLGEPGPIECITVGTIDPNDGKATYLPTWDNGRYQDPAKVAAICSLLNKPNIFSPAERKCVARSCAMFIDETDPAKPEGKSCADRPKDAVACIDSAGQCRTVKCGSDKKWEYYVPPPTPPPPAPAPNPAGGGVDSQPPQTTQPN
jgi:hypothetical protein